MNTFIILVTLALLFGLYFFCTKKSDAGLEILIRKIHLISLVLSSLVIIFLFYGFRFIGQYTSSVIGTLCLITGILLFGVAKTKKLKIYSGLIAISVFISEASLIFGQTIILLPAMILYLIFSPPIKKEKINSKYNFEIRRGGFLAPPQVFYLTKRSSLIFDKQIQLTNSEPYFKIRKIEIVSFTENKSIVCKFYGYNPQESVRIDTLEYAE